VTSNAPPSAGTGRPAAQRLAGLDLLRGLAVAGMIVVNTPGSWSHVWWPLDHAEWHGWTPTDLVFPTFLFAMGVALGLSFPYRLDAADQRRRWWRVVRRSLALIGLGLLITAIAHRSLEGLRIPGVLQRIGVTYALAAAIGMLTARRGADGFARLNLPVVGVIGVAILIGYWAAMTLVPVPGFGAGRLDPDGNLAGWVDRAVLTTRHMWPGGTGASGTIVYDPEGLLSTLPALVNVLIGMIVAALWRRDGERSVGWIALGGLILFVAGMAMGQVFPINKKLWTSSFVLLTSGAAMLLLVLCIVIGRSARWSRLLAPFRMLGMNAILAYLLGDAIAIAADQIHVRGGGEAGSLHGVAYDALLRIVPDPLLASHLYALLALVLIWAIVAPFDRRGIHLRL